MEAVTQKAVDPRLSVVRRRHLKDLPPRDETTQGNLAVARLLWNLLSPPMVHDQLVRQSGRHMPIYLEFRLRHLGSVWSHPGRFRCSIRANTTEDCDNGT